MMTDAEDADEMTEVTGPLALGGIVRVARTLLSAWLQAQGRLARPIRLAPHWPPAIADKQASLRVILDLVR